ncbi:MAG: exo-alpha-sialidase, partial [Rhodanobacteraceae bacterium]|nr:exo-alpha-sialidase [Rhodanobacteraceae bacterium]
MNIKALIKRWAVAIPMALAALGVVHAGDGEVVPVQVSQTRGADAKVDYAALTRHGPWDDRNYALTAADVALLGADDTKLSEPIPAFFRVLLRKEMAKDNAASARGTSFLYPRSGLNRFLQAYGGYQINGVTYTSIRAAGEGRYEILTGDKDAESRAQELPNYVGGEKRVSSPAGMSESAISIHPTDTRFVIAGSNGAGGGQRMWRSGDGGLTWQSSGSLPETCCDPTVGWSPDGNVAYTASLAFSGTAGCVRVYRSTDKGATWSAPVGLTTASCDKEYLHVDMHATSPRKGNIYVSWHESNTQYFSRSTDGGVTFSAKKSLDTANRGIGSDLTTDTAGNVYFFYPTTSGTNRKTVRLIKSSDGGNTFGTPISVHVNNAEYDFPIPAMESRRAFIYVAADSDRTSGTFKDSIYAAWTDTNGGDSETASANHAIIKVGRSRDGGATWTINSPHPTSDSATVDRFHPWISVDNAGRVHVIYYDTRHSVNRTGTDIYHSVSSDGGVTWSTPTRKTTVTSSNIGEANEWGDYNGLDSIGADIIAIYTDNRNESGGTAESVDVYSIGFATGGGGNAAPTANFSFTTSGLTATFTDSSTDSDGTIASRSWNFGDGSTSTATNPTKTYAAAGTYTVTLTVTDNAGAANTKTSSVT